MFLSLEHFYFCHCFVFRYSYFEFLIENLGFRSSTMYANHIMFAKDSYIEMTSPPRHKDTKAIHWKQQFFVP